MNAWTLHLGDCIEGMKALADKSVDHVICDPPYSERVHKRLGKEGRSDGIKARDELTFSYITVDEANIIAEQSCRIARRWMIFFCDELSFGLWVTAIERAGGEYVRKGTYVKVDAMPQMSGDRPCTGTEEIVIAHAPREKGRMRWNGGGKAAVYRGMAQERDVSRVHPAQKPEWLMEAIVSDFTEPSDLILDPYAGSGSTGVGALRNGRRFIGFERDEKYHAIATKRLTVTREQLGLFKEGA